MSPERGPKVAVFNMAVLSHFRRCRPLIEAMTASGMEVVVFSARQFEVEARAAGADFVDLFAGRPLDAVDDVSMPFPCRYVSWAGRHASEVIEQARGVDPQLVVLDSVAVIGRVVATALGVPHVNVCAGHNIQPDTWIPLMNDYPRKNLSDACEREVVRLRNEFGLEDASPMCWIPPPSPYLNVYCEPPEFLSAEDQAAFAPIAFFGSVSSRAVAPGPRLFPEEARLKVYLSLGTFSWVGWPRETISAGRAIASQLSELSGVRTLFGMGVAPIDLRRELSSPTVTVEGFADQRRALAQADVFITHHGLNSTHEAIFDQVPMISYPFEWDQPALAARCQEFDLAVPLVPHTLAPIEAGAVHSALERVAEERERLAAGLAEARRWEEAVMATRRETITRLREIVDG